MYVSADYNFIFRSHDIMYTVGAILFSSHLYNICRLFSEGGNYCPEEVEPFAKKMVRRHIYLHMLTCCTPVYMYLLHT